MTKYRSPRGSSLSRRLVDSSYFESPTGCVIWTGHRNQGGYGILCFDKKNLVAHRAVYELTHGQIPAGMFVCHTCDTPRCINIDHLWLGTPKDNTQDMDRKGRRVSLFGDKHPSRTNPSAFPKRERHYKSTLTIAQREMIRCDSRKQRDIAKDYGVSQAHVWRIKHNLDWSANQ